MTKARANIEGGKVIQRDQYATPARSVERQIDVKKSRFITNLWPLNSRAQAHAMLEHMQRQYPDATHHCFAWLIGHPNYAEAGMSDDGEPSGSAGKPIFNVIRHKKISDVMVVVSRYFGGIKLGVGGLTRSYAASAEKVLSAAGRIEVEPMHYVHLRFDFSREQILRHWCQQHHADIIQLCYEQQVVAEVSFALSLSESFVAFCGAHQIQLLDNKAV